MMTGIEMADDDALVREALRVYRRYSTEVVEGLNLCPWAERARRDGHVRERVLLSEGNSFDDSLAALSELAADEAVEIGLLIYPRISCGRLAFDRFVADLRRADEARHEVGKIPFATAAFHPDAEHDDEPERLIPYLRRTPDPTIQCVRTSVLDRVRANTSQGTGYVDLSKVSVDELLAQRDKPSLREGIARANHATVRSMGRAAFDDIIADILRDRNDSYARFGVAPRDVG